MHGLSGSAAELREICASCGDLGSLGVLLCPPFHLLKDFVELARGCALEIGAQDCHYEAQGAFTGDISAAMIAELGAKAVICGHSERRTAYGESNALVKKKAEAAARAGLHPIICIGESKQEYEQGKTLAVLSAQVAESIPDLAADSGAFTLAYEPCWAIGTGIAAQDEDIARAHAHISSLTSAPILYGGSVSPENAAQIAQVEGVGGFLIGSASLKAQSFLSIISACKPFYS